MEQMQNMNIKLEKKTYFELECCHLKKERWEQERPKGEDPSNQNNQAPCNGCVEIDVVPGNEI